MASMLLWIGLTLIVGVPEIIPNGMWKLLGGCLMVLGSILLVLGKRGE